MAVRNEAHYARMLEENPSATFGVTLAARAVYAVRHGDATSPELDEFREIVRALIARYGEQLNTAQLRKEMKHDGFGDPRT